MSTFGKPPSASTNAKPGTQPKAPEPPKKPTGKNAAKANSGEGGKAYGSPTVMTGVSGTGFDPGSAGTHGPGDRWSYGNAQESSQPAEWHSGWNEGTDGGGVWRRDGWNAKDERGNDR